MSLPITLFKPFVSVYLIESPNSIKGQRGSAFGVVSAVNDASVVVNEGDYVYFPTTNAQLVTYDWQYYIVDENEIRFRETTPP